MLVWLRYVSEVTAHWASELRSLLRGSCYAAVVPVWDSSSPRDTVEVAKMLRKNLNCCDRQPVTGPTLPTTLQFLSHGHSNKCIRRWV